MTPDPTPPVASLSTSVSVHRSLEQIRQLVERFGAVEFAIRYDPSTRRPCGVAFQVLDPHLGGALPVALSAPTATVLELLKRARYQQSAWDRPARLADQAERVAWRNLHDFVRASLIGVQTGIMTLGEAFMASLVVTLPSGERTRLGEVAARGGLVEQGAPGQLRLGKGGA